MFNQLMREENCEDEEDDDGEKSTTSSHSTSLLLVTSSSVHAISASSLKSKAHDRSKVTFLKCKEKGHNSQREERLTEDLLDPIFNDPEAERLLNAIQGG